MQLAPSEREGDGRASQLIMVGHVGLGVGLKNNLVGHVTFHSGSPLSA
jgi:hypothetical protein